MVVERRIHVVVLGEMLWLLRGVVHVVGEMSGSCCLVW